MWWHLLALTPKSKSGQSNDVFSFSLHLSASCQGVVVCCLVVGTDISTESLSFAAQLNFITWKWRRLFQLSCPSFQAKRPCSNQSISTWSWIATTLITLEFLYLIPTSNTPISINNFCLYLVQRKAPHTFTPIIFSHSVVSPSTNLDTSSYLSRYWPQLDLCMGAT